MLQMLGVREEGSGRIEAEGESYREKEKRGGVIKRVVAGGDTVFFFALHLLWAHWSRVHWGRGQELGLEPGDIHWSWNWGIRPGLDGGCV